VNIKLQDAASRLIDNAKRLPQGGWKIREAHLSALSKSLDHTVGSAVRQHLARGRAVFDSMGLDRPTNATPVFDPAEDTWHNCEHCTGMAPPGMRFCCKECEECEHAEHDAEKHPCAGLCPMGQAYFQGKADVLRRLKGYVTLKWMTGTGNMGLHPVDQLQRLFDALTEEKP